MYIHHGHTDGWTGVSKTSQGEVLQLCSKIWSISESVWSLLSLKLILLCLSSTWLPLCDSPQETSVLPTCHQDSLFWPQDPCHGLHYVSSSKYGHCPLLLGAVVLFWAWQASNTWSMPSFWAITLMVAAFMALPTMICQLKGHKSMRAL